jgi:hypothetical protein
MCVSLAALRRCRASSTTKLPKASAAVSAEGKAELIEQQHGVHQQQTMAWGGEEGDVQDGEKGTHEELPPPRTQLSPDPRYQPATDANVEAGTFPCPETSTPSPAKRRLRALAPLPNRVASLEQVPSLPPSLSLFPCFFLSLCPRLPLSLSPFLAPPLFFPRWISGSCRLQGCSCEEYAEIRNLKKAGG